MTAAVAPGALAQTDVGFAETLTDAQPRPKRLPTDIGDHINQYEIIRELGRGGMGAVYLARDTKLARRVAIKLVLGRKPELNERFVLEARATARCSHENIVVIHEVNEYRGTPFMVLEYLEGQSLGRLLATRRLAPQQAVELMIPVVRALVCAHAQDIVHRDLKPDNVFVTEAGTIKVLDFGIAKLLVQDAGDERGAGSDVAARRAVSSTATGALMGTLPYMSPEQWQGVDADHRTDLWSAGVILYEMIVGRHPLGTLDKDTLATTGELDLPMPPARDSGVAMPEALAALIDRCLVKPREQRIGSAQALLDALEALRPARPSYQRNQGENPYLGLHSFQESDADRYFGRTCEIDEVLARLRNQPLVGVTGPTGIGKSSFVRAGVIAALARSAEPWETAVVRPGRDPLSALAAAVAPWAGAHETGSPGSPGSHDAPEPPGAPDPASVDGAPCGACGGDASGAARPHDPHEEHRALMQRLCAEPGYLGALLRHRARAQGRRILLVVDPFEELYTLGADSDTRLAFTACLAGAADDASAPVRVLVSVRSDFLDRVAEDRHFLTELMSGLLFLGAPDRRELAEALSQPADMAGYRFESQRMIDEILDSVEATPGSLPLLQFVATKLWELRDAERCLLTEQSYCDIGGIFGALASHADAVVLALAQLSPHGLDMVRAIFGRLVTAERTRAPASLEELRGLASDAGEVDRVIAGLVDARLLIVQKGDGAGGATVEIVHDSLLHSWPRLRRWLEDSQEDLAFLEQLRAVAKRWDATGRAPGLLWRDEAVREARRWHGRYHGTLPTLERAYLDAAFALADRTRRLRHMALVGTLALLAVLCAGAFWAARRASDRAVVEAGLRHELQDKLGALQDALANLDRSERARQDADAQLALQLALLVEHAEARRAAERAAEEATARSVESRKRLLALLGQLGPIGDGAGAGAGQDGAGAAAPGLLADVMSRIGRGPAGAAPRGGDGGGNADGNPRLQGRAAMVAVQPAPAAAGLSGVGTPAQGTGYAAPSERVARMEQELERIRQALALAEEQARAERDRLGRELAKARGQARTADERAAGEIERAVGQAEKARDRLQQQLAKERARNHELENRIGKLNRRLR